ncbi:MAG: hypothetical protein ACYDEO_04530 [Aggregatilineales bacterium]
MSSIVQTTPTRSNQATSALVLGVASIVFALLTNAPGQVSFLGFLSPVAALLAVIAGLRALGRVSGQQRTQAIVGILAGIVGVILFVVFFTTQVNVFTKSLGPQTFNGGGVQMTYPGTWQLLDISQTATCKQTGYACVVAVGQPDRTNITVIQIPLQQALTMDTATATQLWQQYLTSSPTANRTSNDMITIGGQPAVRWVFDTPSQSTAVPGGHEYLVQVNVIKGLSLYTITAFATSADALTAHRADVDNIINSITFTS